MSYFPNILIMDSGAGGIAIADAVHRVMPYAPQVILADRACFPYGEKTGDWLNQRLFLLADILIPRFKPAIVIIGCNSATTHTLASLRARFPKTQFVGTVPAVKPAVSMTTRKKIAILGTSATLQSDYLESLIATHAPHHQWLKIPADDLIASIEETLAQNLTLGSDTVVPSLSAAIKNIVNTVSKSTNAKIDTMVLGCTHFTHIESELKKALPQIHFFADSAEGVARYAKNCYNAKIRQQTGQLQPRENIVAPLLISTCFNASSELALYRTASARNYQYEPLVIA